MSYNTPDSVRFRRRSIGNPYVPLWEHMPDGEPRVFEDPDNPGRYRIYVIGSHDVRVVGYCGYDIRCWSAPVEDLTDWRDDGAIFTYQVDGRWDIMFAPDIIELKKKDGTREYYLYPHSRGKNRVSTVARSDRPDGPFTPINMTEDGTATLPGSLLGFDPGAWIEYITDTDDPDYNIGFRAYGYWGFQKSFAVELDQNGIYAVRDGRTAIERFIPAGARGADVGEDEGITYPHVFEGEDLHSFNFFEASSIRKVGNKYLFIYSGHSGPEYGLSSSTATLRYAYGDSALGPWRSGGVLVDARAILPNQDGSNLEETFAGHNTHGSIELINDQYYVFYHRCPRGFEHARQAMVSPVKITWDKLPVSEGGKVAIRGYNPYDEETPWSPRDAAGNEYTGAEVTSEGFHIFGLNPYAYYSAGYACYLSHQECMQDSYDIWDNHMPLVGLKNGYIAGYKYLGFGGLDQDSNGLKSFEGTKPGNNTTFNLFLTPKSEVSFKINVWLDGPWDNEVWNGRKLGVIEVPANTKQEVADFTLDVASAVDHLDGKHAIFLVVEGPDSDELCDLIGLGFSSDTKPVARFVPPTVEIQVNGKPITLPPTPVVATSENGIIDYGLYEIEYDVSDDSSRIPEVTASATDASVVMTITQAESTGGTAIVAFDYAGVVKTYRILFSAK